VLIDCSHDNSGKDYRRQPHVLEAVAEQLGRGSSKVLGVMIESHIEGGRQEFKLGTPRDELTYGVSITDGCVDFRTTEGMLATLARAVQPSPALDEQMSA
jgi:3-deoxy-7-phosphoheptulonate synthase